MTQSDTDLEAVDHSILSIIQSDFPLSSRPYAAIAQQIGISEQEAFLRIRRLRKSGIIRRIGANFDSSKLVSNFRNSY